MRLSRQTRPQGIALFIVMIAIFVLSVMAAIFAASMKVETKLAINAEHEEQLLWLGQSGVEYCKWVLSQENCPYTSLNQVWAHGPGSECDTNLSVQNPVQAGDGSFTWSMTDLDSRVNINTANPQELQQALTLMGVDANDISIISDSILDWISPGDNPRLAGAKSDYYQSLDPPYYCKDAPMDNLSELLLVRGVWNHPAIYWGGSVTNHPPPAFQQEFSQAHSPFTAPDYPFGLKDIFTPISDGQVNVNTADRNVLQLLLMTAGMDMDTAGTTADNIIKQRAGPDGVDGTDDDTPFVNLGQLIQAGVPPPVVGQLGRLCTTRSSTFEVHVTTQIPGVPPREYVAILLRRSPADIQILSFYWK